MLPPLDISGLFPLRYIQVRLIFTRPTKFPFLHRYILAGFLRHLLESPKDFSRYFRLHVPENGQIHYAKGQAYHFGVVCLPEGENLLQLLLDKLSGLPDTSPFRDKNKVLNTNIKLDAITDVFSKVTIGKFKDIFLLDYAEFKKKVRQAHLGKFLTLQWLSPVRIKKTNAKQFQGEAIYCADADDLPPEKLFYHIFAHFADWLNRPKDAKVIASLTPKMLYQEQHCFWVAHSAKNTSDNPVQCGGMLGKSTLQLQESLSFFWQQCLFLAQFTGVGNLYSYGWGHYQIADNFPLLQPAKSLLERSLAKTNLNKALKHCQENLKSAQKTKIKIPDLVKLSTQIQNSTYKVSALQAWTKVKDDGELRIMSTPYFADRVLQRAVSQIITPALDNIFYQHSYGYRVHRSREDVMRLIQQEYENGYRWVFESDVDNFFDVVEWDKVEQRLVSLFGFDECIQLIMRWVKADLTFGKHHIVRSRGLPQGAPISPILSNMILDDFDHDMQKAGFKLIRFADDFIVLAKDKAKVEQAQKLAKTSLAEHGFELHPDKTQVCHQDDGYEYLGYVFLSDQVFSKKAHQNLPSYSQALVRSSLVVDKPAQILKTYSTQTSKNISSLTAEEPTAQASTVFVTGDFSKLTTLGNHLQISQDEVLIQNLSWQQIQAIFLIGKHHISPPALYQAMQKSVPIYFMSAFGTYQGELNSGKYFIEHKDLWLQQNQFFSQDKTCLHLAQSIVYARAYSQLVVLRQKATDLSNPIPEVLKIKQLLKKINTSQNLTVLNGYEGKISVYYFKALQNIIPTAWDFTGRNRRPPKDAFNVLLSLGYSSLYAYTQSLIRISGLYPYSGFYHQKRGKHAVLASDLMEPFRYIVERVAMRSVSLKRIKLDDFVFENAKIILKSQARKKYLGDLFARFNQSFVAKSSDSALDVCQHLLAQNQRLIDSIYQADKEFSSFRIK